MKIKPAIGAAIFGFIAVTYVTIKPAHAVLTNIDLSSYVNANYGIHPSSFPTGVSLGTEGTGISFDIATFGSYAGIWAGTGGSGVSVTIPLNVSGQASFYALLNNAYGTTNAIEYRITISTLNNGDFTWDAVGGVDTRDYHQNIYTNTLAPTTLVWFNNGQGERIDMREFDLPAAAAGDTVTGFKITQVNGRDFAMFAGLTFSTEPATVPEPAGLAVLGAGLLGLGAVRRRRPR